MAANTIYAQKLSGNAKTYRKAMLARSQGISVSVSGLVIPLVQGSYPRMARQYYKKISNQTPAKNLEQDSFRNALNRALKVAQKCWARFVANEGSDCLGKKLGKKLRLEEAAREAGN